MHRLFGFAVARTMKFSAASPLTCGIDCLYWYQQLLTSFFFIGLHSYAMLHEVNHVIYLFDVVSLVKRALRRLPVCAKNV